MVRRRFHRWLVVVLLGLGLAVLLLAVWDQLLRLSAEWLDVAGPPAPVDAVMVLPGDAERRPYVAAAIIKAGLAHWAILTRTEYAPDVQEGVRLPSEEVNRRVLVHRGVPSTRIILMESRSGSTQGDARSLEKYLAARPRAKVAIVTSAFHTRRARWTFTRQLPEEMGRISFVAAPNPGFRADDWWQSANGLTCVLSEYAKLVYYWFRYGTARYWAGAGLVGIVLWVTWRRRRRGWRRPSRRPPGVPETAGRQGPFLAPVDRQRPRNPGRDPCDPGGKRSEQGALRQ